MTQYKSTFIQNIYYMLSYAFQALRQENYKNMAVEKFAHVHDLFAAILAKGIAYQLKQGLYREYRFRKDNIATVRGRIDLTSSMKNRISRRQLLTCEYDELSENNLLNQILKTTVMILLRHGEVKLEYKDELKKVMLFFVNVDLTDLRTVNWSSIRFYRYNKNYQMLIGLCQLLAEGMLMTTDTGENRLASFIDEQRMNRLFEKFVLQYYIQECPQITAAASQIPWALDDGVNALLPTMHSDIMLARDHIVLIIDTKYYSYVTQQRFDRHSVHSHNLYQIFTYVKNKDALFGNQPHRVSGMLLYAATDEAIQPACSYQMSGNQISVRTLDLNCSFAEIEHQLKMIITEHFVM